MNDYKNHVSDDSARTRVRAAMAQFRKKDSFLKLALRVFLLIFIPVFFMDIYLVSEFDRTRKDLLGIASTESRANSGENGELKPSPYVEAMKSPRDKEVLVVARRQYNKRAYVIQTVEEKMNQLRKLGMLPEDLQAMLKNKLSRMEASNKRLLKLYESGLAVAESQYAADYVSSHAPDASAELEELNKRNQEILEEVNAPVTF